MLFLMLMAGCFKRALSRERHYRGDTGLSERGMLASSATVRLTAFAVSVMFYPVAHHLYEYFTGLAAVIFAAYQS